MVRDLMYTLNKCCITSPFSLSLLCLSASSTGCFSFPAPSHFPQKFAKTKKKIFCTHFTQPQGPQNLQLSSQQEASQRFCHLQKRQRCHAIGFTADQWEGSIRGECCEKGKWGCMCGAGKEWELEAGPDVSTLCVGASMDKRRNMSVREWACVKDVFAPTFSSAAQGGL